MAINPNKTCPFLYSCRSHLFLIASSQYDKNTELSIGKTELSERLKVLNFLYFKKHTDLFFSPHLNKTSVFRRHTTQLKPLQLKGVSVANLALNVLVLLWHLNKDISILDERIGVPLVFFQNQFTSIAFWKPFRWILQCVRAAESFYMFTEYIQRFRAETALNHKQSFSSSPRFHLLSWDIFKAFCFSFSVFSQILCDHCVTWTLTSLTTCCMQCWCQSCRFDSRSCIATH